VFLVAMNEKVVPCIGMKELKRGALDGPAIGIFRGQEIRFDFMGARSRKGAQKEAL
jgi:hypothetical protein